MDGHTSASATAGNNEEQNNELVNHVSNKRGTNNSAVPGPGGDRRESKSWHSLASQMDSISLEDSSRSDSSRSSNISSSNSCRSNQRQNSNTKLGPAWMQNNRSNTTYRNKMWGGVSGGRHFSATRSDDFGLSGRHHDNSQIVQQKNHNLTPRESRVVNTNTTVALVKRDSKRLQEPVQLPIVFLEFVNRFPDVQCPLSWNLTSLKHPEDVIRHRQEKLEQFNGSAGRSEAVLDLINLLMICVEYIKMNNSKQALEFLSLSEDVVNDPFFIPYSEGVHHVLNGCKMAITFASQSNVECAIEYSSLSAKNKSFILTIRGAMIHYYTKDLKGLCYIREAIALDETNPFWRYMLGRFLGSNRRSTNRYSLPTEEEMTSLKFAVEHSSIAGAYIQLAEANRSAYFVNKNPLHCSRANKYFKKGLKLNPNCPVTNVRCARGLASLSNPYQDLCLAKECVERALETLPNDSLVNHYSGLFYLTGLQDYRKAKQCFEKAIEDRNFPAHISLLSLISTHNPENEYMDLKRELSEMLNIYSKEHEKVTILCQRGYYSCFTDHQMSEAIEDWIAALEILPGSPIFKRIKPLGERKVVNLLEVMKEQIEKALQRTFGLQRKKRLHRALQLIKEVEDRNPD